MKCSEQVRIISYLHFNCKNKRDPPEYPVDPSFLSEKLRFLVFPGKMLLSYFRLIP